MTKIFVRKIDLFLLRAGTMFKRNQEKRMDRLEQNYLPRLLSGLEGLNSRLDKLILILAMISGAGIFTDLIKVNSPEKVELIAPQTSQLVEPSNPTIYILKR